MDAFCHAGFSSSLAFCQVGDAENLQKAASDATRPEIKRFWEVGDAEEASLQEIKGVGDAEGYGNHRGNKEEEKLSCDAPLYAFSNGFCEVGDGHGFHEAADVEADDWVSPRISFSTDFIMSDTDTLSASERREGEHDIKDNYSAEFAFLKDSPAQGAPDKAKGFMLSADELFFDGKLLPLPFLSIRAAGDDLSLSTSADTHRQEGQQKSHNRPISRHLSFDIPHPSSSSSSATATTCFSTCSTCPCISLACKGSHVDKALACSDACVRFSSSLPPSPSPSPPPVVLASPSLPPSAMSLPPVPSQSLPSMLATAPTSPLPSSSVTKCSTKFIHLFKSKIFPKDSPRSQHTRDDSATSTCRLPISSRSFWPFSRSYSAGTTKSTAPPALRCRSNSAGVSHTCDVPSLEELDVIDLARWSTSSSVGGSEEQGAIPTMCAENSHTTELRVPLEVASPKQIQKACPSSDRSLQPESIKLESPVVMDRRAPTVERNLIVCNCSNGGADTSVDKAERRMTRGNVDFQGELKNSGKKVIVTSGKGSPGKGKEVSGVKANGGKAVLRNLERCSAERNLGRDGCRGLNRRGSSPVGVWVSPMLNVALCRGPRTPKIGFFQLNTSLFSKKEKPTEVAFNWRKQP